MKIIFLFLLLIININAYAASEATLESQNGTAIGTLSNPLYVTGTTGSVFAGWTLSGSTISTPDNVSIAGQLYSTAPGITLEVCPTPGTPASCAYSDPQTALNALPTLMGSGSFRYTVQIDDGTYNLNAPIEWDSAFGAMVDVKGQNEYTGSITSVQSSSGSSHAWSVILNVNSVTNIAVNDYVGIYGAAGGTLPHLIEGGWKVTNVDAVNTRITITNTSYAASISSGAVTASMKIFKTILKFTGTEGYRQWNHFTTHIQKIAFVGDNTTNQNGIDVQDGGRYFSSSDILTSNFDNGLFCNYNSEVNFDGYLFTSSNTTAGINARYGCRATMIIMSNGNGYGDSATENGGLYPGIGSSLSGNQNAGNTSASGGNIIPVGTTTTDSNNVNNQLTMPSYIDSTNITGTNGVANNWSWGNVSIGSFVAKNQLDVQGATALGSYAGTQTCTSGTVFCNPGNVGIGTFFANDLLLQVGSSAGSLTTPNGISVKQNRFDTTGTHFIGEFTLSENPGSSGSNNYGGIASSVNLGSSNNNTGTVKAVTSKVSTSSSGTMGTAYEYFGETITASGAITNGNVFYANDQPNVTNAYGFRGVIASGTSKYNAYMDGTAPNYFLGNVGIGSTNPGTQLDIQGSLRLVGTGAGAFRIQSAANQACTTTCTTGKAIMGFDQGTLGAVLPNIVSPTDTTADECLCGS